MDARPYILGVAVILIAAAFLAMVLIIRRVLRSGRHEQAAVGTRLLDTYAPPADDAGIVTVKDEFVGPSLAHEVAAEPGPKHPEGLESEPARDDSPAVSVIAESQDPRERPREVRTFEPIAPVELRLGGSRVGVRPGTPTFEEYQRLARALLGELRQARRQA